MYVYQDQYLGDCHTQSKDFLSTSKYLYSYIDTGLLRAALFDIQLVK